MFTIEKKATAFLAALDEINFQNLTFFVLREPGMPEDIIDKLHNHCRFTIDEEVALFGFMPDSDLPNNIRKQCLTTFKCFFPNGGIVGEMYKW